MTFSVVISGSGKGIGLEVVKLLATRSSTTIFAGARDVKGLQDAIKDVKPAQDTAIVPVHLDVTSDESIEAAAKVVKERTGSCELQIGRAHV